MRLTETEIYAVCLLVVGYPPRKPPQLLHGVMPHDWFEADWNRKVSQFYRDYRGTKTNQHCEPRMSQFVRAYANWLSRQTNEAEVWTDEA